jgi:hypothetical protein
MVEKRIADRFDECEHKLRQVVIKAAEEIRKARGLPEEKNITILFNETAPLLGVAIKQISSRDIDHLPIPGEMRDEKGRLLVPRKDCPKCSGVMVLGPICPSCVDSENGKYHSGYKCEMCQFVDDKNEMFFAERLTSMGVEVPQGIKQAIGIKTLTDKGLE